MFLLGQDGPICRERGSASGGEGLHGPEPPAGNDFHLAGCSQGAILFISRFGGLKSHAR